MSFVIGVSLAQRSEHSAIVVAEYPRKGVEDWVYLSGMSPDDIADRIRTLPAPAITDRDWPLHVVHVGRWERGIPYQTMVDDVARLAAPLTLEGKIPARLMVDTTEVGQPILNLFHHADLRPIACVISGGTVVNWSSKRAVTIPKRDLVMSAVALLDAGRLRWSDRGAVVQTMERELRNFRLTYSKTGTELFELERREHDDLVLALSMTTWTVQLTDARSPFHVVRRRARSHSMWAW